MGLGSGSEIRDSEKTYSGSRIQGSKRQRIPDTSPDTATSAHAARHECVRCTGKGTGSQVSDPGSGSKTMPHKCTCCTAWMCGVHRKRYRIPSLGSRIRIQNTAAQVDMLHGMNVCRVQVHATIDLESEPSFEYNKECSRWQNLICTEHCTLYTMISFSFATRNRYSQADIHH
jgi:hypothetical protein